LIRSCFAWMFAYKPGLVAMIVKFLVVIVKF
jgi:hypothetical protein